MANIITKTSKKNILEIKSSLSANGVKMETVYVDGRPFCCLGSNSEVDKMAALNAIKTAIDNTDSLYEAMLALSQVALISDSGKNPTEQIEVEGAALLIDYDARVALDLSGEVVADCSDLNITDHAAIKELLKARYSAAVLANEVKSWKETYIEKICGVSFDSDEDESC